MNTATGKEITSFSHLLDSVYSAQSSFYRSVWSEYTPNAFSKSSLPEIPTVSWKNWVDTPYSERLYTNEPMYVKVVDRNEKLFLVSRTLNDIRNEDYGPVAERPLVLFEWAHEGIEKSLWCFEHNILPLISEGNLTVVAQTARKYEIDSILCEMEMLKKLVPVLAEEYSLKNIKSISIIDQGFDTTYLLHHFEHAKISLNVGLPETGVFAHTTLTDDNSPTFEVVDNSFIEIDERGCLIVTRLFLLPTPVIRYQTYQRAVPTALYKDNTVKAFKLA